MASQPEPVLFEAVCTQHSSFDPRVFRALATLAAIAATLPAIMFLWLGAWPILGFLGGEVALVLALVLWHARRSGRVTETLLLAGDRLAITRTDARGRREAHAFDAYWARARLVEDPAGSCRLFILQRDRRLEIGRSLGAEERRALGRALADALGRYRSPVFDNPQLWD